MRVSLSVRTRYWKNNRQFPGSVNDTFHENKIALISSFYKTADLAGYVDRILDFCKIVFL